MPIIASIIASVALIISGWMYVQPEKAPSLGASQTISSLTELTSLSHNDVLPITDTAGGITKKVKWGTATSSMKTVFDTIYSPIFSDSAGLAGLLSDETGSGGGFVRATAPTIASPVISSPAITVGSDATGDLYYRGAGGFTRLGVPSGVNYYLRSSSTNSQIPEWDNSVATFPYTSSSTFTSTVTSAGTLNVTGTWTGNVPGLCHSNVYSSSTLSTKSAPIPVNFEHNLGYTPRVFRAYFTSRDNGGNITNSQGWGVATTTGTTGGSATTFFTNVTAGTNAVFGTSTSYFIHPRQTHSTGGNGVSFAPTYVNYTSATNTQLIIDLTSPGNAEGTDQLFFTLEQCL